MPDLQKTSPTLNFILFYKHQPKYPKYCVKVMNRLLTGVDIRLAINWRRAAGTHHRGQFQTCSSPLSFRCIDGLIWSLLSQFCSHLHSPPHSAPIFCRPRSASKIQFCPTPATSLYFCPAAGCLCWFRVCPCTCGRPACSRAC